MRYFLILALQPLLVAQLMRRGCHLICPQPDERGPLMLLPAALQPLPLEVPSLLLWMLRMQLLEACLSVSALLTELWHTAMAVAVRL